MLVLLRIVLLILVVVGLLVLRWCLLCEFGWFGVVGCGVLWLVYSC